MNDPAEMPLGSIQKSMARARRNRRVAHRSLARVQAAEVPKTPLPPAPWSEEEMREFRRIASKACKGFENELERRREYTRVLEGLVNESLSPEDFGE